MNNPQTRSMDACCHDSGTRAIGGLIALLLGLLPIFAATAAPSLITNAVTKYSGRYIYRPSQPGQPNTWSNVLDFTVRQIGCSWRIDLAPVPGPGSTEEYGALIAYQSDGRHIYMRKGRVGDSKLGSVVSIYDEPYPPSDAKQELRATLQNLQHIWMGYAAGCVMPPPAGEGRSPFLVTMQEFGDPRKRLTYRFSGDGSEVRPRTIEIFDIRPGLTIDKKTPLHGKGVWTRAFVGGVPCEQFAFGGYWNFMSNGIPLPLESYHVECVITNAVQESFALDLPKPGTPFQVYDRRATKDGYAMLQYTTDMGIPDPDSAQFKRIRDRSPKLGPDDDYRAVAPGVTPGARIDTRNLARWILYLSPAGTAFGLYLGHLTLKRRRAATPGIREAVIR